MQELDDIGLLREYVERGSEAAFAALVERHINKVYSVALRHTGNPHQAEEITQAVFVILARKSRQLSRGVILYCWLYKTARFASAAFIRSEVRRARREQEACMANLNETSEPEVWPQIAPLLDAALAALNETDRRALVLRFFYGKTMKEIGADLGANEDAAKKRVDRALDKLQIYFSRRGVCSVTTMLAGTISACSVQVAPATLAKTVTAVALTKGAAASASTLTLIKGALKIMAWTKAKTTVVAGMVILLAVGTATTLVVRLQHSAADGMISSPIGDPKTAEQAATVILEDWGKGDWNGFANRFVVPGSTFSKIPEPLKKLTTGLQLVSVGKPDNSSVSNMWLVPCTVRLKDGKMKAFHLHLEQSPVNDRWIFNGFSE